jgi:hypothetical protein
MGQAASAAGGLKLAAERGCAAAQAELGTSLFYGLNGVERNEAAAAAWQGLTLVHLSAQLERFLWDRGCAQGL